jgi:hypothetical protein
MGFDAHAAFAMVVRLRMHGRPAATGQCSDASSAVNGAGLGDETVKKKARPRGNAPSNKTFGNCLLGFHCSQRTRPDSADFLVFLPLQSTNSETYTHFVHSIEVMRIARLALFAMC